MGGGAPWLRLRWRGFSLGMRKTTAMHDEAGENSDFGMSRKGRNRRIGRYFLVVDINFLEVCDWDNVSDGSDVR